MDSIKTNDHLARLVYLAATYKPDLPSQKVIGMIPQGLLLKSISKHGIKGASVDFGVTPDQLMHLMDIGSKYGEGSIEEFRLILSELAIHEIELRGSDFKATDYISLMGEVSTYVGGPTKRLFETSEIDLSKIDLSAEISIPKFDTGFTPFDRLLGGLYQSVSTIIARPGHGKTSLMLTMMGEIARTRSADQVWFYELEIPRTLMEYRINPLSRKVSFRPHDRLICGYQTIQSILSEVKDSPNPDRIIIIDSPDVIAGGAGDQKRYVLEDIYMNLISLKMLTKAVITTSWPRRKDVSISLESVSDAWAKSLFSDIVIGLTKKGRGQQGLSRLELSVVKNRFGFTDRAVSFSYNFADLSWHVSDTELSEINDDW